MEEIINNHIGWHKCIDGKPGDDYKGFDWVLVRYREKDTGWENTLPHIAEFCNGNTNWSFLNAEDNFADYYINTEILEWKPIDCIPLVIDQACEWLKSNLSSYVKEWKRDDSIEYCIKQFKSDLENKPYTID